MVPQLSGGESHSYIVLLVTKDHIRSNTYINYLKMALLCGSLVIRTISILSNNKPKSLIYIQYNLRWLCISFSIVLLG